MLRPHRVRLCADAVWLSRLFPQCPALQTVTRRREKPASWGVGRAGAPWDPPAILCRCRFMPGAEAVPAVRVDLGRGGVPDGGPAARVLVETAQVRTPPGPRPHTLTNPDAGAGIPTRPDPDLGAQERCRVPECSTASRPHEAHGANGASRHRRGEITPKTPAGSRETLSRGGRLRRRSFPLGPY